MRQKCFLRKTPENAHNIGNPKSQCNRLLRTPYYPVFVGIPIWGLSSLNLNAA